MMVYCHENNRPFLLFQDGFISFKEFIIALSVTSRGTLDEKLDCKYVFLKYLQLSTKNNSESGLLSIGEFIPLVARDEPLCTWLLLDVGNAGQAL